MEITFVYAIRTETNFVLIAYEIKHNFSII